MRRILIVVLCALEAFAVPQFKGGFDNDDVNGVDTKGQTFKGHISSGNHIDGNYNGKHGNGPVSVDNQPGGKLAATANGKRQTADIDKGSSSAVLKSSGGDNVNADGRNGKNIPVVVKGSHGNRNLHIVRQSDNDGTAVDDATGKKFQANGLRQGSTTDVGDGTNNYASKYVRNGPDTATQLKAKVIGNVGPAYTATEYRSDPSQEGVIKSGFNPIDTGGSPFNSLTPQASIQADKIRTESCPEGQYGDAFGKKGFDILHKSVAVEVDPISTNGNMKTYAFPSCFIMKAQVRIPPNVNIEDVAGQLTAYVTPVGNLECEASKECPDKQTANRPQGHCFYCNFCNNGQGKTGAVFGSQTDVSSNLCSAKSGQILPLSWKVCPPPNAGKYDVFQKDLLGVFKTDMDVTIRIFVKSRSSGAQCTGLAALAGCNSNGKAWALMGCRHSIISYSVGGPAAGGAKLGSGAFGK